MKHLLSCICVVFLLSGCVTVADKSGQSISVPSRYAYNDWMPPANPGECKTVNAWKEPVFPGKFAGSVNGYGGGYDDQLSSMVNISYALNRGIMGDYRFDGALAQFLRNAAEARAWTSLDFSNDKRWGKSSPAFASAHLSLALSNALIYLRNRRMLTQDLLDVVIPWGNVITRQATGQGGRGADTLDSRTSIAVAYIAWGVATRQDTFVENGYREYLRVVGTATSKGTFAHNLKTSNDVVQPLVVATAYLRLAGIDTLDYSVGKEHTILDLFLINASLVANNGHHALRDWFGNMKDIYYRSETDLSAHQSWIPIFFYLIYGRQDVTTERLAPVLKIDKDTYAFEHGAPYYGLSTGGFTACFWGRSELLKH